MEISELTWPGEFVGSIGSVSDDHDDNGEDEDEDDGHANDGDVMDCVVLNTPQGWQDLRSQVAEGVWVAWMFVVTLLSLILTVRCGHLVVTWCTSDFLPVMDSCWTTSSTPSIWSSNGAILEYELRPQQFECDCSSMGVPQRRSPCTCPTSVLGP